MNDRSKDYAPRGTQRGSCGSVGRRTHSRTLSALGTNWLWRRASSMCWKGGSLPCGMWILD